MQSIFWNYFKNTLGWALIHSPGAISAIAKGVALVFDDVRKDIFWLRDQLNPATCEDVFVARHGAARGMEQHPLETDGQYRSRVVRAFTWHRQGGKAQGMPQILKHHGYEGCGVHNCKFDDAERWAEFAVSVPANRLTQNDYGLLSWTVQETKPARSKLAALRIEASEAFEGSVAIAGRATTGISLGGALPHTIDATQGAVPVAGVATTRISVSGSLPVFKNGRGKTTLNDMALARMLVPCTGMLPRASANVTTTLHTGAVGRLLVPVIATMEA